MNVVVVGAAVAVGDADVTAVDPEGVGVVIVPAKCTQQRRPAFLSQPPDTYQWSVQLFEIQLYRPL